MGVNNFKVMDTRCTTNCTPTANTAIRVSELRQVTKKDAIHFRPAGYKSMANRCTACLHTVDCTNKKKQGIHFWRVFRSTRGSTRIPTYRAQPAWGCGAPPGYRGVASRGRFPLRTVTWHTPQPYPVVQFRSRRNYFKLFILLLCVTYISKIIQKWYYYLNLNQIKTNIRLADFRHGFSCLESYMAHLASLHLLKS